MGNLSWHPLIASLRRIVRIRNFEGLEKVHDKQKANQEIIFAISDCRYRSVAALEAFAREQNLPLPKERLQISPKLSVRRLVRCNSSKRHWGENIAPLNAILQSPSPETPDIAIVPVQVIWGNILSQRAIGWLNPLTRCWHTCRYYDRVLLEFGEPICLNQLADSDAKTFNLGELIEREIETLERRRLGPPPPDRKKILNDLVNTEEAQSLINSPQSSKAERAKLRKKAKKYSQNMVADMRHSTLMLLNSLLLWFMRRVYEGVDIKNLEQVSTIAGTHSLIYTPCHRSHMDYLLLGHCLIKNNFPSPHIISGDNLDVPIIGRFLRRGGAVFMRRSFSANKLYRILFENYIQILLKKRYPIEYFMEGGRSRTGRLLQPKLGLLRTTLDHCVKNPDLPIKMVPVNICYDRQFELNTYHQELSGLRKSRESIGDLYRVIKQVRQNHGKAYLTFGEPIDLQEFIANCPADTREKDHAQLLGSLVMSRINAVSRVTPINLIATVLLGSPRLVIDPETLREQLEFLCTFITSSSNASIVHTDPEQIIKCAIDYQLVQETPEGYIAVDAVQASMLAYYRNNVCHLFATAGAIALAAQQQQQLSQIKHQIQLLYPYIHSDYTMPSPIEEKNQYIEEQFKTLTDLGLFKMQDGCMHLNSGTTLLSRTSILSRATTPALERLYILASTVSNLSLRAKALGQACSTIAQNANRLLAVHSPEYYETTVFLFFIQEGITLGAFNQDQSVITPGANLPELLESLESLLPKEFIRCIQRLVERETST